MAVMPIGIVILVLFILAFVFGLVMLAFRPAVGATILGVLGLTFVMLIFGLYFVRVSASPQVATPVVMRHEVTNAQGERLIMSPDGRVLERYPAASPMQNGWTSPAPPQRVMTESRMKVVHTPATLDQSAQAASAHSTAPPSPILAEATEIGLPTPAQVLNPQSTAQATTTQAPAAPQPTHGESPAVPPVASQATPSGPAAGPAPPAHGISSGAPLDPNAAQPAAHSGAPALELPPPSNQKLAEKLLAARPAWVDAVSHREGQTYQATVKSGLFVTYLECERALDKLTKKAVDEYIDQLLEDGAAQVLAIDVETINRTLRQSVYHEELQASVGPMQQISALVVIDEKAKATFQDHWRQVLVERRLWKVGSVSVFALVLLGTLFTYLKLDLKTAGACARRLQLTAAVTILLAVAGAVAANRMTPPRYLVPTDHRVVPDSSYGLRP